ncbi:hypothetical protein DPMN_050327 [Dreissena polymorpha]|uniref:Sushi domain-containing protein n=1 Tax=Dreissena polymorpha TaxID=45954 RepID=A0A9D4CHA7_DREPO|nr:hypothetical protein DPMN_050327 [Dreissena polymorpha]
MYSCNPGYKMFGENSITCLDTGNWSKLLVNCAIKGEIVNGTVKPTNTAYVALCKEEAYSAVSHNVFY